jgi:hypothetical protein
MVLVAACGQSDLPAVDNSGENFTNPYDQNTTRLDQTPDATIAPALSVACSDWNGTKENSWYRVFPLKDLGVTGAFTVHRVNFAVQTALGGEQRVKVSVGTYAGTAGSVELDPAKIDVLGLTTLSVLEGSDQMMQANFAELRVPADTNLIVEIKTEGWGDGRYFYLGATTAPETVPGYLRAPSCNTPNPMMTNALGYSQSHLIISVSGSY